MEELTDANMVEEIRRSLSVLDNDEALQLLPPVMLEELYKSVTCSVKLIRAIYGCKEIEKPTSDSES